MRQRLSAGLRNGVQPLQGSDHFIRNHARIKKAVLRRAADLGNAAKVFLAQQTLCQLGEGDGADPKLVQRIGQPVPFDPTVQHVVAGLVDQTGGAKVIENGVYPLSIGIDSHGRIVGRISNV